MEKFFNIAGWTVGIVEDLFHKRVLICINRIILGIVTYIDYGEDIYLQHCLWTKYDGKIVMMVLVQIFEQLFLE